MHEKGILILTGGDQKWWSVAHTWWYYKPLCWKTFSGTCESSRFLIWQICSFDKSVLLNVWIRRCESCNQKFQKVAQEIVVILNISSPQKNEPSVQVEAFSSSIFCWPGCSGERYCVSNIIYSSYKLHKPLKSQPKTCMWNWYTGKKIITRTKLICYGKFSAWIKPKEFF